MTLLRRLLMGLGLGVGLLGAVAFYLVMSQGVHLGFWEKYEGAAIAFDEVGIPTITGRDWLAVIEAQAYVVAAERLWQMDLLRRKAGGRLSAWFGPKAFPADEQVWREERPSVAQAAAAQLPPAEAAACHSYAAGVNRFIKDHPYRWGIEYLLLGVQPEPWQCSDSLLVLLEMMQQLSGSASREAQQWAFGQHLPRPWFDFIYPHEHPWNEPMFGRAGAGPTLPPPAFWLPAKPLQDGEEATVGLEQSPTHGSNQWAYRGQKGFFLANDPHLRQSVPGIWYALRLKVANESWAVGVSLPGVPGIVLGMNAHLAWSFTNNGEDVDDLIQETLSADGQSYEDWDEQGGSLWRRIEEKRYPVVVRGEDRPREIVARSTARGPLYEWPELGGQAYARQWLALRPQFLRIPSLALMQAQDLASLNRALDDFKAPAQNIIAMDRSGRMAYRASGTGVVRQQSGLWPLPAKEGRWLGFEPASKRRQFMGPPALRGSHEFLATANERIWSDGFPGHWAADDRKQRIKSLLQRRSDYEQQDMEAMQADTHSLFRKQLLTWIERYRTQAEKRWQAWDGTARDDSVAFAQAGQAEAILGALLVGRLQRHYLAKNSKPSEEPPVYNHKLQRAWIAKLIAQDAGFAAFGLEAREVAQYLDRRLKLVATAAYEVLNRNQAQHPFVANLPLLGRFFRVKETPQFGGSDTLAAETPLHGPSVRLLWNLAQPQESTWLLPLGQSGHIASPHYDSMRERWQKQKMVKVFPAREGWDFGG